MLEEFLHDMLNGTTAFNVSDHRLLIDSHFVHMSHVDDYTSLAG